MEEKHRRKRKEMQCPSHINVEYTLENDDGKLKICFKKNPQSFTKTELRWFMKQLRDWMKVI